MLAISNAAARLFSTKGYLETSMDDVAKAARTSKGGVYHYFDCKGDILYFIVNRFMDIVLDGLEEGLEGIEDPVEKVRFVISRHVEIYVKHRHSAKVILNEAYSLPPQLLKKVHAKEREYFSVISGVLSGHMGHSTGKEDLTVVTFSLLGTCNWIYSWYDPKGPVGPDRLSEIIFGLFMNGLPGGRHLPKGATRNGKK